MRITYYRSMRLIQRDGSVRRSRFGWYFRNCPYGKIINSNSTKYNDYTPGRSYLTKKEELNVNSQSLY